LLVKYFFISNVPIIIFERTINPNSVPTLYTPHVPSFLKVANRVPEFVPRTEANDEPCDYGWNLTKLQGHYWTIVFWRVIEVFYLEGCLICVGFLLLVVLVDLVAFYG